MSKHLLVGSSNADHNWRLPAETDLHDLLQSIELAMRQGTALHVAVEMHGNPLIRANMVMNGKAVPYVVGVDVPDDNP